MAYPEPLEKLITSFQRFPGIGRRSAERLAFHVLRDPDARALGPAIQHALAHTKRCGACWNVAESDPCAPCSDPERDRTRILVVEEPRDVEAVERAGVWQGLYHVLLGALNPSEGTDPRHLSTRGLLRRLEGGEVVEVVLGTDPDREGEATALHVREAIASGGVDVRVTRLARGLPAGSAIEYLHRGVLEDALEGRVPMR